MAHYHLDLGFVGKCLLEVIGQTLGSCAHGVDVHTVGTGTHDAAQAACAEFEVFIERLYQLGLVGSVEHTAHLGACSFVIRIGEPCLGLGCHLLDKFLVFHVDVCLYL